MASGITSGIRLSTACLAVGLALASTNCSSAYHACTLIGCENGLRVEMLPSSGWPEGRYRFVIDADGQGVVCTGSLPLPACGTGAVTCDRTDVVRIGESGCALAQSGQGFPEIRFDSALRPRAVTIEVLRNDASVGRTQLAPQFRRSQPNGEDCGPICEQASATMQLAF